MQVKCTFCNADFGQNVLNYNKHIYRHRNVHNFFFTCVLCDVSYKKYTSFQTHFRRNHAMYFKLKENLRNSDTPIVLKCSNCDEVLFSAKALLKHCQEHFSNNESVACPIEQCLHIYDKFSSLKAHFSRHHSNTNMPQCNMDDTYNKNDNICDRELLSEDLNVNEDTQSVENNNPSSLLCFLLKLTGKHLIPESTVQIICNEISTFINDYSYALATKLKMSFKSLASESEDARVNLNNVLTVIENLSSEFSNSQYLQSSFLRKKSFFQNFNYIAPICYYLNSDNSHFFHYVSLEKSLSTLLCNETVQEMMNYKTSRLNQDETVLEDFEDGSVYKATCKDNHKKTCNILLYQDGFEVCNPIGSSKKIHKMIAVYALLVDVPKQVRSKIDNILLTVMCKEKYLKLYGYSKIMKPLVDEITSMQQNGFRVKEDLYTVNVVAMCGDNLGSNGVGGLVESFSSHYYCRYCLASKTEIQNNPLVIGELRNKENIAEHVEFLIENPDKIINFGVKENSVLNSIQNFHITSGLPPCLAHDIFEGVASWDIALVLRRFIKEFKWFSHNDLNDAIQQFSYFDDSKDKPAVVPDHIKHLGGHALQNRCLVKFLPLILIEKIKDLNDANWEMVMILRNIIELVMAPKISLAQISYLKVQIEGYLQMRYKLFPTHNLKPKHHFLLHYPMLISKFGPLRNFWTMRFESKHQYFKQSLKQTKNFKNVTATLTEKHQLLNCYLTNGRYYNNSPLITTDNILLSDISGFAEISNLLLQEDISTDCCVAKKVEIFGQTYKKDRYIICENEICKIKHILYQSNSIEYIYFVVETCEVEFCPWIGAYEVTSLLNNVKLVLYDKFLDYSCMHDHDINNRKYLILNHSFLDS